MKAILVVDTQPIIAWMMKEEGWADFQPFFESPGTHRIITPLTMFEMKSVFLRQNIPASDQPPLLAWVKTLCELRQVDEEVALRAAEIRFRHRQLDAGRKEKANLSMADAIAVALAEEINCPLLSGERGLRQVTEVTVLPGRESGR